MLRFILAFPTRLEIACSSNRGQGVSRIPVQAPAYLSEPQGDESGLRLQ